MKVCFLTREPEVCRLMVKRLDSTEIDCTIHLEAIVLYEAIRKKELFCDLLILDYKMMELSVFDLYERIRELDVPVPLIFYNDPYPTKNERVAYWMSQNTYIFRGGDYFYLFDFFCTLNDIIEDPAVHPYISLLQPPLPISLSCEFEGNDLRQIDLKQFRLRNHLPPMLYRLFVLLYDKRGQEVSVQEMAQALSIRRKHKPSSMYSYISRLKKYIADDPMVKIEIYRTDPGYYEMVVY